MIVGCMAPEHGDVAARVLAVSFRDYPYMRYVLERSAEDYERHLNALSRFTLDVRWAQRHPVLGVHEGQRMVAVATVVEPDSGERSQQVERLFARLKVDLGDHTLARMETYEAAAKEGRPEAPHHYLGMLGVLPEAQGAGHGGLLVARVKELAQEHSTSTGVCLNTETVRNVALYEHLGFDVVGEGDTGSLRTWCMFWRSGADGGDRQEGVAR